MVIINFDLIIDPKQQRQWTTTISQRITWAMRERGNGKKILTTLWKHVCKTKLCKFYEIFYVYTGKSSSLSFILFIHSFIHSFMFDETTCCCYIIFFPFLFIHQFFFSLDLGGSRTFILGLYSAFFALFLVLVIRFFFSFSCLFGPFLHYNCCNMFFFVVAPSKFHV